jgi:phosphohistidine phosphatase
MQRRTLLLMRHAKASPSTGGVSDSDRRLLAEGKDAAARVGAFIKREQFAVDFAISSPAVRARETIESVLQAAGMSLQVHADQRLYEGGPLRLWEVLAEVDDNLKAVLVVGHNPVLEEFVHLLTEESVHLSPGTLAHVEVVATGWSEISKVKHKLRRVVRPQELDWIGDCQLPIANSRLVESVPSREWEIPALGFVISASRIDQSKITNWQSEMHLAFADKLAGECAWLWEQLLTQYPIKTLQAFSGWIFMLVCSNLLATPDTYHLKLTSYCWFLLHS